MNRKEKGSGTDTTRRDLLRYFTVTAGCFVAPAGLRAMSGVSTTSAEKTTFAFPQGVASGDPQSDTVVLWTRVEGREGAIRLTVQVSQTTDFEDLVSETAAEALPDLDHTIRVLVTGLESDRHYYYRFIAPDGSASRVGRTCTAPHPDVLRPLKMAVFSCQDYELGYFTAYRRVLLDDEQAADDAKIDFAVHLGDFIYETVRRPGPPSGNGSDRDTYLNNSDGTPRRCTPLPSGGTFAGRNWVVPAGLADYRALYKAYLLDPDLQEMRARYPFVQTWDDHEFKNDAWQSYSEDEPSAELKVAANQAWFEYIPAALSLGGRDVSAHSAKDFKPVRVKSRPAKQFDENFLSLEENNLAAVNSMTIYRSLRWGRMAELFMIDTRSYRGPRGFPQELLTVGNHPYPPAPIDPRLIDILSEGRTAQNRQPPDEIEYLGRRMPNPRKDAPFSSMLGGPQKSWFLDGLKTSEARWKLIGTSVGLMRHGFDSSFREDGFTNGILWTDGWDGYPAERKELTRFIRDQRIGNVVSLTGDRHMHMAGVVLDDFDSASPTPVVAEFAGSAVSATTRLTIQSRIVSHDDELAALVTADGAKHGYANAELPTLNAWLLYGAAAARAIHEGVPAKDAARFDNDAVNRHLIYTDADAHGCFTMRVNADRCEVEFITIQTPVELPAEGEAPVRRRVRFSVDAWINNEGPVLKTGELKGEPPIGGLRS